MHVESLLTSDEAVERSEAFAEAKRLFAELDFAGARAIAARLDGELRQRARALAGSRPPSLASVVVVTYGDRPDFEEALKRLAASTVRDGCEFILVDNGSERARQTWAQIFPNERILDVGFNSGCSGGRNLGAEFAAGDVVVFIDDDGLVSANCIEMLLAALDRDNAVAVRGRVLPKAAGNETSRSYDMGLHPRPSPITAEGVSAFRRGPFLEAGGFDTLLSGHEGALLSTRLYRIYGPAALLYEPGGILYHDYAPSTDVAGAKRIAHDRNLSYVFEQEPAYKDILNALRGAPQREISVQYFVERGAYAALTRMAAEDVPGERVSVITTAHNARAFLRGYHASLARQTTQNFEIVFVDDGSTDGTVEATKELFGDDPRLRLVEAPRVGRAGALNIAMREASCEICVIADVDDVSLPYRFRASREILAADPSLDCISFPMFDDRMTYILGRPHHPQIRDFKVRALFGTPAPFPSFAFRRSRFREPFDPAVTGGIDYDWIARNMLEHGVTGRVVPIHGTYYHRHADQISTTRRDEQRMTAIRWLTEFHRRLLPDMTAADERLAAVLSGWTPARENDIPHLRSHIFQLTSAAAATDTELARSIADAMFARVDDIELTLARATKSPAPPARVAAPAPPRAKGKPAEPVAGPPAEAPAEALAKPLAKPPPILIDNWPEPPWPVLNRMIFTKMRRRLRQPIGPRGPRTPPAPPSLPEIEGAQAAGKWPEPPWPVLLKMLALKTARRLRGLPEEA